MEIKVKDLPKSELELTFTLTPEDMEADLQRAAAALSEQRPIEGYRPGKAPYDIVKSRLGEMAIYEAALSPVIRRVYVKAVTERELRPFGEPHVHVTKVVPGSLVEFTAKITLVPAITKLADYASISVKKKAVVLDDAKVDAALRQLSRMQTKEIRATHPLTDKDKAVVDMRMSRGGVPIEGGQAIDHSIYLNEEYFIPGLKEKIVGANEGDERTFTLRFPKDHFKKDLADKDVDFTVKVKEIYDLDHPPLDDAFAKTLGQESMAKLRELLRANMTSEAEEQELQRAENELLEKLVDKTRFGDIADGIVTQEVDRMVEELERNVVSQGGTFDDYLASIKKSVADLKLEFVPQALARIKTALVVRDIGEKEQTKVDDDDVLAEQQKLLNTYKDDPEIQERIRSEEYEDFLRNAIRNRKVVEFLRTNGIK